MAHIENVRYEISVWDGPDDNRSSLVEVLARVEDYAMALAAFEVACEKWPEKYILIRERGRIIRKSWVRGV